MKWIEKFMSSPSQNMEMSENEQQKQLSPNNTRAATKSALADVKMSERATKLIGWQQWMGRG